MTLWLTSSLCNFNREYVALPISTASPASALKSKIQATHKTIKSFHPSRAPRAPPAARRPPPPPPPPWYRNFTMLFMRNPICKQTILIIISLKSSSLRFDFERLILENYLFDELRARTVAGSVLCHHEFFIASGERPTPQNSSTGGTFPYPLQK